jgi:hypothetical protein
MDKNDILDKIRELKDEVAMLDGNDNTEEYDEMLDDSYGDVKIAGIEYSTSYALKNIDEIAYNCGHSDFNSSRISDLEDEIEELEKELKNIEE